MPKTVRAMLSNLVSQRKWCLGMTKIRYQILYQVLGVTYGWSFEGLFVAECIPHAKIHWLSVSAKEWMASENIEAEPEYAHPITFNTKLTAFLKKKKTNTHIRIYTIVQSNL